MGFTFTSVLVSANECVCTRAGLMHKGTFAHHFFLKCLSQTDLLSNASDDFLYQGNDSSLVFVILDFFGNL